MKSESFQTIIPTSGNIKIPREILENFAGHPAKIVIQEIENSDTLTKIRKLKGKYHGSLSSSKVFSRRKIHEKELESSYGS